jgi:hypothetical protein
VITATTDVSGACHANGHRFKMSYRRVTQQLSRPFDPVESFGPPRHKGCKEILDEDVRQVSRGRQKTGTNRPYELNIG